MHQTQPRDHSPDPTMQEVEIGKRPASEVDEEIVSRCSEPKEGEVPDRHDACEDGSGGCADDREKRMEG